MNKLSFPKNYTPYYVCEDIDESLRGAIKFLKANFARPSYDCGLRKINQTTLAHYDPENVDVWNLIMCVENYLNKNV